MSNDYSKVSVKDFIGQLFKVGQDGELTIDGTHNLFRDWFFGQSNSFQLGVLRSLAKAAGGRLLPQTVLRPVVITRYQEEITPLENRKFPLEINIDEDVFIMGMTATVVTPKIAGESTPSGIFEGKVDPLNYFRATIGLGDTETPVSTPTTMTALAGVGSDPYLWPIVPFLGARATMKWHMEVDNRLLSADRFELNLHCMRFPTR